ncbi:hypothetical protein RAA17_23985 [Komagataeibacter rhaeticus]|nr:hypothetical protein [Komagataeibacter rhaeticus]
MPSESRPSFLFTPAPQAAEAPPGWWQRLMRRLLPQSLAARTTLLLMGAGRDTGGRADHPCHGPLRL